MELVGPLAWACRPSVTHDSDERAGPAPGTAHRHPEELWRRGISGVDCRPPSEIPQSLTLLRDDGLVVGALPERSATAANALRFGQFCTGEAPVPRAGNLPRAGGEWRGV